MTEKEEQDQYKLQLAGFRMSAFDIAIKLASTANEGTGEKGIFSIYDKIIKQLDLPS